MTEYLADERVVLKNKDAITFKASLKVFVQLSQTRIIFEPSINPVTVELDARLEKIKKDYENASGMLSCRTQERLALKLATKRYR